MTNPKLLAPRTIRLETPHYIVRTMESTDATEGWRNWLKDPATLRNLNSAPVERTQSEFVTYIARFNRTDSHLLGIFEKETGTLVGVRSIYIEPKLNEFMVNVLVGEVQARNKGARSESSDVMYRYFFGEMDMAAARCTVVATNEIILRVMDDNGWVCIGKYGKPAVSGDGTIEIRAFRLTREAWQRKEAEKARAASRSDT